MRCRALQHEVTQLAGARYARGAAASGIARWGTQRGSVYLADQKLPIRAPPVRDLRTQSRAPVGDLCGVADAPLNVNRKLFRSLAARGIGMGGTYHEVEMAQYLLGSMNLVTMFVRKIDMRWPGAMYFSPCLNIPSSEMYRPGNR